jgi:hypothetical protein
MIPRDFMTQTKQAINELVHQPNIRLVIFYLWLAKVKRKMMT